ncbi:MAG: hypothetical protein MJ061_02840, partial [Mailhella sp.]|nr:hypothetical protein [Mailhella sp.]
VRVAASPVYCGTLTAQTRACLERLLFPVLNYMPEVDGFRPRTLPREKRTALVLTMNVKESMLDAVGYRQQFGRIAGLMGGLLGSRAGGRSAGSEILYVCDTWQFIDYAKYDADMFDEGAKRARREGFFAEDLEKAHELGRRLCSGGDAD